MEKENTRPNKTTRMMTPHSVLSNFILPSSKPFISIYGVLFAFHLSFSTSWNICTVQDFLKLGFRNGDADTRLISSQLKFCVLHNENADRYGISIHENQFLFVS